MLDELVGSVKKMGGEDDKVLSVKAQKRISEARETDEEYSVNKSRKG